METWQFWTLIGVISAFGIVALTFLWGIYQNLECNNDWLRMLYDRLTPR